MTIVESSSTATIHLGSQAGDADDSTEPATPAIQLGSFERKPISQSTRRLLCQFAAADPSAPLEEIDADWQEVFEAVCRNGLIGLTHLYQKQRPGAAYPPPYFRRWVALANLTANALIRRTQQNVKRVLARFHEAGLECLVLKGPALAEWVYPDPNMRWYADLDVHVRTEDVAVAHALLQQVGLVPDDSELHSHPKLVSYAPGDEWNYWSPDHSFQVELHGDDLLHAGLVPRDYEGFWSRAVTREVQGIPTKVLALDDQLIALSAHVHYHGYTRLNWLSDIALIVRDYGDELDWDRLINTVRSEQVQVPVYYTLYFLQRLLGVAVPERVLRAIRPDWFRRWVHDQYLPKDKVASLQPMPRPDFSFYFLPLFSRLIPDFLVMGRRADKVRYILRLLRPAREWMRDYYGVAEGDGLAHHYALHPLKLAWHYILSVAALTSWWSHRGELQADGVARAWWSGHARTPGWRSNCH